MSKDKNFEIKRDTNCDGIRASDMDIGDMFERQGSLHMRVKNCHSAAPPGKITICNMNTGSVWNVDDTEMYALIKNCQISYCVKL